METLKLAYEVFENDMAVINIIADDDFISVTEFSKLLSTILEKKIKSKFINKILVKKGVITRKKNKFIQEQQSLNHKINKYIVNPNFSNHCEERTYNNGLFYVWKANFLFGLLSVDLKKQINENNVSAFCTAIKNNVGKNVAITKVSKNLLYLQFILKRESIFYR